MALAKPPVKGNVKPLASETANLVAKQLERQMELNKLASEAAKRESERVRLEQIEKQKAEERLEAAKRASEKERAERKARAIVLAAEAMQLFNEAKFAESEAKFKEAVDLDPENRSYYFKYGAALYRNGKYNEALVIFGLADADPKNQNEKNYFIGLCHYRLKELPAALSNFTSVASTNDPVMAPSSEFYRGVIFFVQEKFTEAKISFEKVIDTSSDPKLDQQAEEYLENISAQLALAKLRENKFTFIGTVGAIFDSNVLLAPDNAATTEVTDIRDVRLLTVGGLEYRPLLRDKHELFVNADATLINSKNPDASSADPFLYTLGVPYSFKGAIGSKGLKTTLKPGYEQLYMATGGASTKTISFISYFLLWDTTLVMNPTWFANYSIEYRRDDARALNFDQGDEDADATRFTLRTNQTFFLDKGRKRAVIGSLGYVGNSALGRNKTYKRFEAGVTFTKPAFWDTTWNIGLNFFKLDYPDAIKKRNDVDLTLSSGLTKPIKEWLIWGLSGNYTNNDSNVDAQAFTKYTIMTTATFITNF